jgi:hypothetical protein
VSSARGLDDAFARIAEAWSAQAWSAGVAIRLQTGCEVLHRQGGYPFLMRSTDRAVTQTTQDATRSGVRARVCN